MPSSKACSASTLRGVIRAYARPFAFRRVCTDLGVTPGPDRQHLRRALRDFVLRGEIYSIGNGKYRYKSAYRLGARAGPLRQRILKAMYVSDRFTPGAIELLCSASPVKADRNYINKVIRRLTAAGYLVRLGRVQGNERQYRIANRDRFHVEVM